MSATIGRACCVCDRVLLAQVSQEKPGAERVFPSYYSELHAAISAPKFCTSASPLDAWLGNNGAVGDTDKGAEIGFVVILDSLDCKISER
jgi:hypothetical protein